MAYDIFRKGKGRDFARGEAPPSDSYEWAGVALPPPGRPRKMDSRVQTAMKGSPAVIVVNTEQRSKLWPWILGAGAVGGGYFLFKKIRRSY